MNKSLSFREPDTRYPTPDTLSRLRRWLKDADISRWFDTFFIAYLYWIAFEWTILSRLGSFTLIQYARNAVDLFPIILLVTILLVLNPKLTRPDLKIFGGFLLIIILSALSLAIERAPVSGVINYIGVTVRFVPFIALVRYTSPDFQGKIFKQIRVVYWIVAALAVVNLFNKELFIKLFLPPADIFVDAVPTVYLDKGISATFIHTTDFSFFILAATTIYLNITDSNREKIFVSIMSLVLCLMSYSIASLISILFVFFLRSNRKWLMGSMLVLGIMVSLWTFSDFFLGLLGMDIRYWIEISSEFNRIGYFTKVLPEFLHGGLKDLFLGMGYDGQLIDTKFMDYKNTPWVMVNNENNLRNLKDVYWVSIIVVQGLIAFVTTGYILVTIWISAKRDATEGNYQIVRTFMLLTLFLGLFSMILDMKAFSFCFWLMAGLAMNKLEPKVAVLT